MIKLIFRMREKKREMLMTNQAVSSQSDMKKQESRIYGMQIGNQF